MRADWTNRVEPGLTSMTSWRRPWVAAYRWPIYFFVAVAAYQMDVTM